MGRCTFSTRRRPRGSSRFWGASFTCARRRTIAPRHPNDKYNHLLVLAENEEGYRNLIRLTSEASLHGFYRKPRVSKKYLAENAKGLIGFSGCLSGELCEELMAGQLREGQGRGAGVPGHFRAREFLSGDSGPGAGAGAEDSGRPFPAGEGTRDSDGADQRLALSVRRGLARARRDAVRADGVEGSRCGAVPV